MKLYNPFSSRDKVLNTNGEYDLNEIVINSKITEEFNGNFMLEATLLVTDKVFDKKVYNNIVHEAIIKERDEHGDEVFRIFDIRKNKKTIDIMCRQITISDQINMFLKDVRPTDTNGQGALTHMYNLAEAKRKEIFITSDISNISTSYFINKNMYDALFKEDNCFVNRWGGETLRRGYNCYINAKVGQNNGVKIQSKKNLKGFEIKSNLEDLTTRIIPRGFDGIEAKQVDSKLINNYAQIYTKIAEYSDVKVKSDNDEEGFETLELAQAELTKRAKQQFDLFNVDKIQATYSIDFVELSKTEQYKDFILMEKVEIGDTVTVIEDTYDIKVEARVISRVYSPSLRKRIETKISNVQQSYKVISVESILKEMEELLNTTKNPSLSDYINTMINAGLKDSYVVLKPNELLIMDNKDINKAKNVTRYNKNGLGFSTTGYYGKYEYGFTIDGKINASLITTGVLTAIKIISADGENWWDLSSGNIHLEKGIVGGSNAKFDLGSGEINFFNNEIKTASIDKNSIKQFEKNKLSVELARNGAKVYSFIRNNLLNGGLLALSIENVNDFLGLIHNKETALDISFEREGAYSPYIRFDKYKTLGENYLPITICQDMSLDTRKLYVNKNGAYIDGAGYISLKTNNGSSMASFSDSTINLERRTIISELQVTGNKKCVQDSYSYGEVSYYSVEDTSSLLTDTKTSIPLSTQLVDGEYICKVIIDDYIQETINTEMAYNVYIDKMGFGDYAVLEEDRFKDYFLVKSDRPLKFKYKLEGRRKGFENERKNLNKLKTFSETNNFEEENIVNDIVDAKLR